MELHVSTKTKKKKLHEIKYGAQRPIITVIIMIIECMECHGLSSGKEKFQKIYIR